MAAETLADRLGNWAIEADELVVKREIGRGSFGHVALGSWRDTDVAIKMLEGGSPDEGKHSPSVLRTTLENEASILMSIRHPNIVLCMGVCLEPLQLVTEFCPRGSLSDCLRKARANPAAAAMLTWPRRLSMALDAAKGMGFLHNSRPPILHLDLKSPNILVDKHWRCKIGDFGLSKIIDRLQPSMVASVSADNPRWLAPEVLEHGRISPAADVYSFGIVLWELLTWSIPWEDEKPFQIVMSVVMRKEQLEIPAAADLPGGTFCNLVDYINLVRRCLSHDAEERPTFGRIIKALRGILDQCMTESGAKQSVPGDHGPGLWTATSAPPTERQLGSGPEAPLRGRQTSGPLDSKNSQSDGGDGVWPANTEATEPIPFTKMNSFRREDTPPPPTQVQPPGHMATWQQSTTPDVPVPPAFAALDLACHAATAAAASAGGGGPADVLSTSYLGWSFQNKAGSLSTGQWAVGEVSPNEEVYCHTSCCKPAPLQEGAPQPQRQKPQMSPTASRSDLSQLLAKYIRCSRSANWDGATIPLVGESLEGPVPALPMTSSLPMCESRSSSVMFAIGTIEEDVGNSGNAAELVRADRGGAIDWAGMRSGGASDETSLACGTPPGDSGFSSITSSITSSLASSIAGSRGSRFGAGDAIVMAGQRWQPPVQIGEFRQEMGSPPLTPPINSTDMRSADTGHASFMSSGPSVGGEAGLWQVPQGLPGPSFQRQTYPGSLDPPGFPFEQSWSAASDQPSLTFTPSSHHSSPQRTWQLQPQVQASMAFNRPPEVMRTQHSMGIGQSPMQGRPVRLLSLSRNSYADRE